MNLLDRIPWDEFVTQVQRVCRWCLFAVFVASLLACVWVVSAWYTERKQALYAPVPAKVEVPVMPQVDDSTQRIQQLEQQIAEFKVRRQREIVDQQKRLANYERQIRELTMLLGDSDLQLRALQEASAKVPAMSVEQAAKVLGVKAKMVQR